MQRYTIVFQVDEFANSPEEAGVKGYQKIREMFDDYGNFEIEVVDSENNVHKAVVTTGPNLTGSVSF